jgi:hypothetical protein
MNYMDDHFGLVDRETDLAYVMDDFGEAIEVPFSLPAYYWQDA